MFYVFNLRKYYKTLKIFLLIILFLLSMAFVLFFIPIIKSLEYNNLIEKYAKQYNLEKSLVFAIIKAESNFDPNAVSVKGATGLMQLMEPTANWAAEKLKIKNFKYSDVLMPEVNINLGCWYISYLLNYYNQNHKLALAAYNAGLGNVNKWIKTQNYSSNNKALTNIPFKETKLYIIKINFFKIIYDKILNLFYH